MLNYCAECISVYSKDETHVHLQIWQLYEITCLKDSKCHNILINCGAMPRSVALKILSRDRALKRKLNSLQTFSSFLWGSVPMFMETIATSFLVSWTPNSLLIFLSGGDITIGITCMQMPTVCLMFRHWGLWHSEQSRLSLSDLLDLVLEPVLI